MKDLATLKHFEPADKLAEILQMKAQSDDILFFRLSAAYYFSKLASMMRVNIQTHDRGDVPAGMYAINLAPSGFGKGLSTNIMEEQVINKFQQRYLNETFPLMAEKNLAKIAIARAQKYNEDPDDMLEKVRTEFENLGILLFSFDSATPAAVKQMRHKLLMANAGSVNLEIDEIGSNLLGNTDVLNVFLELYDVGKVKAKLIKNTIDNKRNEAIEGRTPTNMMLYGTPAKLLNNGKEEEAFWAFLETGYARRCFFSYTKAGTTKATMTPLEMYNRMTDNTSVKFLKDLSIKLGNLADCINFGIDLSMTKDVSLLTIEYKLDCDRRAAQLRDHQEILKAEITHRYFKAIKLAGAYAFIDGAAEVTEDHFYNAVKLVEESGEAFAQLLNRERNYVRLAKYIADAGREVTQVDLDEDLAFFKGSESHKKNMMTLATAWGYRNNIIIKKSYIDNIEFLVGESLEVTDLDSVSIAYSQDITTGFIPQKLSFDDLHKVTTATGYHYTAHNFTGGYRTSERALPGFNLAIIDIDDGPSIETAKMLLKGFKFYIAETKRSTPSKNRYRIIFPMNYIMKLTPSVYKEFMQNLYNWLPFSVDDQTKDIARKWEAFDGAYEYVDGELLDTTLFIPQTKKGEEQAQKIMDTESLSNLERWFLHSITNGNRSNQIIKYALVLVDQGFSVDIIRSHILNFNAKLKESLSEEEIERTIMVTAIKAVGKRELTETS